MGAAKIVVAFIAAGSPPPVFARHGLPTDTGAKFGAMLAKGDFGGAIGAVNDELNGSILRIWYTCRVRS